MRRETWMLASAVMALILGGGQAKAGGGEYGFLYNGTTYTTLAVPGAISTDANGVSGGNVVGDYHERRDRLRLPVQRDDLHHARTARGHIHRCNRRLRRQRGRGSMRAAGPVTASCTTGRPTPRSHRPGPQPPMQPASPAATWSGIMTNGVDRLRLPVQRDDLHHARPARGHIHLCRRASPAATWSGTILERRDHLRLPVQRDDLHHARTARGHIHRCNRRLRRQRGRVLY